MCSHRRALVFAVPLRRVVLARRLNCLPENPFFVMSCNNQFRCAVRILSLVAAVVLLGALSVEVITGDNLHFPQWYLNIQFIVCAVFIAAFFADMSLADDRLRYFVRYLPFLVLSVPYVSIFRWCGVNMTRECMMVLGMITLLRAFLAMYVVVRWIVTGPARQLFFAYLFTVVVFTYLSGLVFYDFEIHVNPHLDSLGDALWWAGMGVTTVGAAIFPVTAVGKIFAVLLPLLGMLMLPVFTVYVTDTYRNKQTQA